MQKLQIRDDIAVQLHEIAAHHHISVSEVVEQVVEAYKAEMTKRSELKQFFNQYKIDLKEFRFSREEANAR